MITVHRAGNWYFHLYLAKLHLRIFQDCRFSKILFKSHPSDDLLLSFVWNQLAQEYKLRVITVEASRVNSLILFMV